MLYKNLNLDIISKFHTENYTHKHKLEQINIHMTNNLINNKNIYHLILHSLILTGQSPKIIIAKNNIASFNVRMNNPVSLITTLKNNNMLKFLKKLITVIIPNNKKNINLNYNNQKDKLTYNIGFDKLNTIYSLEHLNNHNSKEGFHLEIIIKSKWEKIPSFPTKLQGYNPCSKKDKISGKRFHPFLLNCGGITPAVSTDSGGKYISHPAISRKRIYSFPALKKSMLKTQSVRKYILNNILSNGLYLYIRKVN